MAVAKPVRRIAVLDDYERKVAGYADWTSLGPDVEIEFIDRLLTTDEDRAQALRGFDCIVLMRERTPISGALIRALPDLRLIMTTGHGNASIDYDAANAGGIQVCGTITYGHPTAELVWGMIIAASRHIADASQQLRGGIWMPRIGQPLKGRTLGIIGLGRIGSAVARVAQAFEMNVQAWSANLTPERAEEIGVRYRSLDDLLSTSDIVTLHVILGDRYRELLGGREIGLMKAGALLVNTSRASIVEEQALLAALRERRIGAALDVFNEEPLPADHPLLQLDNVLATPHLGYVTEDNFRNGYAQIVAGIKAFRRGEVVLGLNVPLTD